jgi:hypothetical protein
MPVPSLVALTLWQLANDPRWNLCTAYEQFLALFDNGQPTNKANTFLDKFLELQVQRRLVWHGTDVIRRFALCREPVRRIAARTDVARRGDGATGGAESECALQTRVSHADAT